MVCDMVIDGEGGIDAYQFYPAVINSHARLTYTEVAAVLANTRGPEAQKRADLVPHLLHLHEVYRALLKQRAKRGAVDFETTETQIVCDENGRIEKIVPRTRNEAHKLIEEAMLAANECAAGFIEAADHPALFRVHEGPTPERRVTLQNYLRALGIGLAPERRPDAGRDPDHRAGHQGPARRDADPHHAAALDAAGGVHRAPMPATSAWPMAPMRTSPARSGATPTCWCTVSSRPSSARSATSSMPRWWRACRRRRRAAGPRPRPSRPRPMSKELETWEAAGAHCSANERRADEASRDVEAWLKCRFMREHLGEEYSGTVSGITSFGLFVTLDALYVEGLVHITELGGEYYRYDEVHQELRGERSGARYARGHAGAGAGQPRRPGQPAHRFPPGARQPSRACRQPVRAASARVRRARWRNWRRCRRADRAGKADVEAQGRQEGRAHRGRQVAARRRASARRRRARAAEAPTAARRRGRPKRTC